MEYKPKPAAEQDRIGDHLLKTDKGHYFDMRERVYTRLVTVTTDDQDIPVVFCREYEQTELGNGLLKARGGVYFNIDSIDRIEDPKFPKESRRTFLEWWRDL